MPDREPRVLDPRSHGASTPPRRTAWALGALVLAGTVLRVVGAFRYPGVEYDVQSLQIVGRRLVEDPLQLYETLRWPYGPVYLPFAAAADQVAVRTGLPFDGLVKLPLVVADAVSAVLVADLLRLRGRTQRWQLAGAALVALGPVSLVVVVAHGQIDPVAFCLLLGALRVWQGGGPSRWLWCGLLVGLAGATKTTPLFALLALLATCRGGREAARLLGVAVAVPVVLLVPWVLSEPAALRTALTSNGGVPGFGSWSLLVQPSLADLWIGLDEVDPSAWTLRITEHQNVLVLAAVLAVAPLLWRRRTDAVLGTALLLLVVQAVNPNLSHQYLVWALLPMAAAGLLWQAGAVSAAFTLPMWLLYFRPDSPLMAPGPYRALALGAWVVLFAVTAQVLLQVARADRPTGTSAPVHSATTAGRG